MEISVYYDRKLIQRVKILKCSFISSFHCDINEIFALLGCNAALIGNQLQKFGDNMCFHLQVSSSSKLLDTWRWNQGAAPKSQLIIINKQCLISQKNKYLEIKFCSNLPNYFFFKEFESNQSSVSFRINCKMHKLYDNNKHDNIL